MNAAATDAATARGLVQADWALLDTTRAFTGGLLHIDSGKLQQESRKAVGAHAFGTLSHHCGAHVNMYGGRISAEHAFGTHHTLGIALGSTHASVGGTAVRRLRQDASHLALYGNSSISSKFSADWAAAFGTAEQHGNTGAARAEWEQNSGELAARVNYTETLSDRTALRTYAGLAYDATGADRTNGYKTGSVQALRGELGMGLTHTAGAVLLFAEAGMVGDMVRHNPTVNCGTYRIQGPNPGRLSFKATVGGRVEMTEHWSADAAYCLETAADSTQQSMTVGVSRKF